MRTDFLTREIDILLVEDNEGDVVLTLEALSDVRIKNKVFVVRDGDEALDYLYARGQFSNAKLPDLILLDINLPRIDGQEVLQQIKNDTLLKQIPVIMLTTSSSVTDIRTAYANHANCYIVKPVDLDSFLKVTRAIEEFWISIVQLPKLVGHE